MKQNAIVTLTRLGNGLGICIPREHLDRLNLREGDELNIRLDAGRLILQLNEKESELRRLVAAITPENIHERESFRMIVGEERW